MCRTAGVALTVAVGRRIVGRIHREPFVACYPRIDLPCPLDIDAQRRIDGYCGHCARRVHRLGPDDARAVLGAATEPVCVSYRLSAVHAAALGLALGGLVTALPAQADSPPGVSTASSERAASEKLEFIVIVGGVSRPGEAEWIDDEDGLPEIPVVTVEEPAPGH